MTLPLPFVLGDDDDPIQSNFDALRQQFPLSRRHMKIERPHVVGDAGEPAFEHSWVNFDTPTEEEARFWKDPMGLIHIQGVVKSGTIGTSIFTLPEGYRPGNGLLYATIANNAFARLDISPTGQVVATSGSNVWFSINVPPFKQEQ